MDFDELMELVVRGFEAAGVVVLALGSVAAALRAAMSYRRRGWKRTYEEARRNVGRAILLGLEFLIVADIVMTITVDPTLESAMALGLIVLVRTFLSFSLEVELEGTLPWRRAASEARYSSDGADPADLPAGPAASGSTGRSAGSA